jgi:hypothetical protein
LVGGVGFLAAFLGENININTIYSVFVTLLFDALVFGQLPN